MPPLGEFCARAGSGYPASKDSTMFEFPRILHPDDYAVLHPYASRLREFKERLKGIGVPFWRKHQCRSWDWETVGAVERA